VQPADIVATGTTVHDEVTVTDQYDAPVDGLFVTFDQSGPGSGVDTKTSDFTNGAGVASDNFSSASQGNATVTADVYEHCFQFGDVEDSDCTGTGGVPLSEHVNKVGFDGTPSITILGPSKSGAAMIAGVTRPGASVQLQSKSGSGAFANQGAAVTAGPDGTYGIPVTVSATTTYQVVVDSGVATSASRTVTISAKKTVEKPSLSLKSKKKGELTAKAKTHPSLSGVTVKFYLVSKSGNKSVLGKDTTNGKGKASKTFKLDKGKTYTLVAKATGLGSKYKSKYSSAHTKKVKG
jgi:hypothetical protein